VQGACLHPGVRLRYDGSMRWWVALLVGGCNQLLGIEPTAPITPDARIDGPGCSDAGFSNPVELQGSVLQIDYDPSTSGDVREIWFTRSADGFDLFAARRADANSPFESIAEYAYDSPSGDFDATLSVDGLILMFVSDRLAGAQVYEARRASTMDTFGSPSVITAIAPDEPLRGIDLSRDGLRLYYSNGTELRMVERATTSAPFGAPSDVLATDAHFPSLSPDELELFHARFGANNSPLGVFRSTRTSTTVAFSGSAELINSTISDPDVSADSTQLYYSAQGHLGVMTRSCN